MQKMDRKKHQKYFLMNVLTAVIIFALIFTGMYFVASRAIGRETYNHEINLQRQVLKHNVDNICTDIDEERTYLKKTYPQMSEEDIRAYIQGELYRRMHSETFAADAYMWVEQVLNYEGGEDYAIRLIHPNLSKTEGSYLSTYDDNGNGEYIYRDELEGVKANGSVFLQYHFKELNSDQVTEKITYSRLYKDYDWIIAMGVNTDVLEETIGSTADIIRPLMFRAVLTLGVIIIVVSVIMQRILLKRETAVFQAKQKAMQKKLNWDQNTSANSRRYGQEMLAEEIERVKEGAVSAVLMMDIDRFKQYNDTYGYDTGDQVLREVVKAFRKVTRTTDSIIRWGGDEFVCILRGVKLADLPVIEEKILESVRNIQIGTGQITISIGGTAITRYDASVDEIVKRADEALYEVKQNGRNSSKVK